MSLQTPLQLGVMLGSQHITPPIPSPPMVRSYSSLGEITSCYSDPGASQHFFCLTLLATYGFAEQKGQRISSSMRLPILRIKPE